jgi:hypothetical protein
MYPSYRGRWLPDTPAQRKLVLDRLRDWFPFSNSSPVEGIVEAIRTYYSSGKRISLYVLGDEFTGTSVDSVVRAVDQINREDKTGQRRVRIHALAFPVRRTPAVHQRAFLDADVLCGATRTFVGLNEPASYRRWCIWRACLTCSLRAAKAGAALPTLLAACAPTVRIRRTSRSPDRKIPVDRHALPLAFTTRCTRKARGRRRRIQHRPRQAHPPVSCGPERDVQSRGAVASPRTQRRRSRNPRRAGTRPRGLCVRNAADPAPGMRRACVTRFTLLPQGELAES